MISNVPVFASVSVDAESSRRYSLFAAAAKSSCKRIYDSSVTTPLMLESIHFPLPDTEVPKLGVVSALQAAEESKTDAASTRIRGECL